jgi:RecA/RadA recombinase
VEEKVQEELSPPPSPGEEEYDGKGAPISTGSTLLDLAISGGRYREGGIPPGILVEIFGPSGSGKTVLLCSLAGNTQKRGRRIQFHDPEARLNKQFARMFGLNTGDLEYTLPNTVTELFGSIRESAEKEGELGVFADSLAALSTNLEMENEDGDKMGMRRAKEFSEELRKTARIITNQNILMVCSNQVRQNPNAGPFDQRYITPGGEAVAFYASLRLRCFNPAKIKVKRTVGKKEFERVVGVRTMVEVYKSSVWEPYHQADVYILYDYGIDDIRGNLMYVKGITGAFKIGDTELGKTINKAIEDVEDGDLERDLKNYTIDLWNEVQEAFAVERKPRQL